ncbi:MAG: hypothetical protein MSG64_01475 [Pyrinomonadaceae bacterium MAG19_C2-C3]|nr:hypothetical protein [Pyrinomonadaceae bacterium MAG19_C2-C3]
MKQVNDFVCLAVQEVIEPGNDLMLTLQIGEERKRYGVMIKGGSAPEESRRNSHASQSTSAIRTYHFPKELQLYLAANPPASRNLVKVLVRALKGEELNLPQDLLTKIDAPAQEPVAA